MTLDLDVAVVQEEGHGGAALRDHAHAAIDDGVLHEAFAGETGVVARRPHGATMRVEGDQRAGGGGFLSRAQARDMAPRRCDRGSEHAPLREVSIDHAGTCQALDDGEPSGMGVILRRGAVQPPLILTFSP